MKGGCCISSSVGFSTVRATAASVPTINFDQSTWSAAYGTSPAEMAVTMLIVGGVLAEIVVTKSYTSEAMLAVSWNWVNIWMLLCVPLPHLRTLVTAAKLSSLMMISEFSFAMSVTSVPRASPTSASLSAGASSMPSPVTATTWPFCFKERTIRRLSNVVALATTRILSTFSNLSLGS